MVVPTPANRNPNSEQTYSAGNTKNEQAPAQLLDCSPIAVKVLLTLWRLEDVPSSQILADRTRLSRRAVQRAIKELCDAGHLAAVLEGSSSKYVLLTTEMSYPATAQSQSSPSNHHSSPAQTRLSTFTSTSTYTENTGEQTDSDAQEVVKRLVKYRHLHKDSYRKREFTLYPKAEVVWMTSARFLLEEDGLPLEEILRVMDFAFSLEHWPPRIKTVYHLRQNYAQILQEYRRSQVADIPHEQWRD